MAMNHLKCTLRKNICSKPKGANVWGADYRRSTTTNNNYLMTYTSITQEQSHVNLFVWSNNNRGTVVQI